MFKTIPAAPKKPLPTFSRMGSGDRRSDDLADIE